MTREEWIWSAESKILDVITGGKSLDDLIQLAFDFLGNPIVVTNERGEMFSRAKGDKPYNDKLWERCDTANYMPFKLKTDTYEGEQNKRKTCVCEMEGAEHSVMVCHAHVGGGFMLRVLMLESHRLFSETDRELLDVFTKSAAYIVRERGGSRFFIDSDDYLLYELIRGRVGDNSDAALRLGLNTDDQLIILVVQKTFVSSASQKLTDICDHLRSIFPNSSAIVYERSSVLLIKRQESCYALTQCLEKVLDYCRRHRIFGCLSRIFRGIDHISDYYKQTLEMLKLGKNINDDGSLFLAKNIYTTYLVSRADEKIESFCYPPMRELLEKDIAEGSDLLPALYAYTVTCGSCSKSAKLLGIHYNSMQLRLRQIKQVMGEEIDAMLPALYLSIKTLFLTQQSLMKKCFCVEFDFSLSQFSVEKDS